MKYRIVPFFFLLLAGMYVFFYNTQKAPVATPQTIPSIPPPVYDIEKREDKQSVEQFIEATDFERGFLFAERNLEQKTDFTYTQEFYEYFIKFYDFDKEKSITLAKVINNFFAQPNFRFYDDKVYFINQVGGLSFVDFKKREILTVDIEGIFPTEKEHGNGLNKDTLNSFLINDDGMLVYFKGYCSEVGDCALGMNDIRGSINNGLIVEDLHRKVKYPTVYNRMSLHSFDSKKGVVRIDVTGGYEPGGRYDSNLYDIDIETKEITQVASLFYFDCEDPNIECTDKERANNDGYSKFFPPVQYECNEKNIKMLVPETIYQLEWEYAHSFIKCFP